MNTSLRIAVVLLSLLAASSLVAEDRAPKAPEGRTVLRRLNRVEYERTICDLLGIQVDLRETLPLDTSSNGFDNVGEALHISSFLMDRYLEAADKSLALAIANGPQPPLLKKRYSLKDTHVVKLSTESVYKKVDDTVICFSSSPWNTWTSKARFTIRGRRRATSGSSATCRRSPSRCPTTASGSKCLPKNHSSTRSAFFAASPAAPSAGRSAMPT